MAKPIAIIYFPENMEDGLRGKSWVYEYMAYLNGEPVSSNSISYGTQKDYWKDYYWFCFYKSGVSEPELKVFYEKDFTDIQFAELKALITQSINEIKDAKDKESNS